MSSFSIFLKSILIYDYIYFIDCLIIINFYLAMKTPLKKTFDNP